MGKKVSDYDRGIIVGIGLACSIIISNYDYPRVVATALNDAGLNRAKLKRAGLDEYDLKMLRPVFAELK